ncbi:hypothetical protein K503DRAFT_773096 [Rhizopogon vinicolor AM-OR11-026]|uniref:Uncharacterized protein n=1 Tax=Rhizopogon vinicolor AM-OR11-026 TaxID=1314800 RepID=A0A1B7MT57_9AGAM|nr:hypothetical protein K503DRAFT_773096 [Rhizopogon vinicolor AM-OR11-026]
MKFTSLDMIVSAVAMAGIATAVDPTGGPCATAGSYECGLLASFNHGFSFVFYCTPSKKVEVIELCTCVGCCSIHCGGNNGEYYTCT